MGDRFTSKQDNTVVRKPLIPQQPIRRTYSFNNLGGTPDKDITYKERWKRQKRESTIRDFKNLLGGLNKTAGFAASAASLLYGGGWAATRLLNGNKSSVVGQALSKYVLPSNAVDTSFDVMNLIQDPSVSNAAEVGAGVALGRYRDFGKIGRQVGEIGSQSLNIYNTLK